MISGCGVAEGSMETGMFVGVGVPSTITSGDSVGVGSSLVKNRSPTELTRFGAKATGTIIIPSNTQSALKAKTISIPDLFDITISPHQSDFVVTFIQNGV
jgi:hypothetical protein